MKFVDQAQISIKAGKGGDGGSVIMRATTNLHTLQDVRYHRIYKAESGRMGEGNKRSGRKGKNIEIYVPVGTVVRDIDSNEVLADMVKDGQELIAAAGGNGGWGNQ